MSAKSFSRAELNKIFKENELEVPKDVITAICELHTTANEPILEELHDLQAQKGIVSDENGTPYKELYEQERSQLATVREQFAATKTISAKKEKYSEMLREMGILEKRIPLILRLTNFNGISLDESGNLANRDELYKSAESEFGDFKKGTTESGVETKNPPTTEPATMERSEIIGMKDPVKRQAEIEKYIEAHGSF